MAITRKIPPIVAQTLPTVAGRRHWKAGRGWICGYRIGIGRIRFADGARGLRAGYAGAQNTDYRRGDGLGLAWLGLAWLGLAWCGLSARNLLPYIRRHLAHSHSFCTYTRGAYTHAMIIYRLGDRCNISYVDPDGGQPVSLDRRV